MYKIGITGSIGTGKTTIAKIFAFFNIPIFDADKEIKNILKTTVIREQLKSIWPSVVKKSHVDKLKLRTIIFSNKKEKKKLEQLLYPYLDIELKKFERINYNKEILVYDVPLIYETKSEKKYDLIILAHCNINLQKTRVLNRDKISKALFEKIVASQLSFNDKIKFKPRVIKTNYKFFVLIKVCLLLITTLIKLSAKNGKEKINT